MKETNFPEEGPVKEVVNGPKGMIGWAIAQTEQDIESERIEMAIEDLEIGAEALFISRKRAVSNAMKAYKQAFRDAVNRVNASNSEDIAANIEATNKAVILAVDREYCALETYVSMFGKLPNKGPRKPSLRATREMQTYREWWDENENLQIPERLKIYTK